MKKVITAFALLFSLAAAADLDPIYSLDYTDALQNGGTTRTFMDSTQSVSIVLSGTELTKVIDGNFKTEVRAGPKAVNATVFCMSGAKFCQIILKREGPLPARTTP